MSDSIDALLEANNERNPAPWLDPGPDSLDVLGAQLLHIALSLRKPADLWDAGGGWPYTILFDAQDLIPHAFILEQMGKARFSIPVSEIQWTWGRGFSFGGPVLVEWVEQASTHMEYVYGKLAHPILMRWRCQGEIKRANDELIRGALRIAELNKNATLWIEHKARWTERLERGGTDE